MSKSDQESVLARDLATLQEQKINRRKIFGFLATATAVPFVGGLLKSSSLKAAAACSIIPTETAGPFPGDGSNGSNVLKTSGIIRRDITSSIGDATGVAKGIPLRIEMTLINAADNCDPLEAYAIYIWQCDREGNYSMYSPAAVSENYLRGVQATDADGVAIFDSIFPACYPGRWPHIHFEVYKTVDAAKTYKSKIATSQIALTPASCKAVFATEGYEACVANLARISLAKDMVFADGVTLQLATMSGSVNEGYVAKLTVAIRG